MKRLKLFLLALITLALIGCSDGAITTESVGNIPILLLSVITLVLVLYQ